MSRRGVRAYSRRQVLRAGAYSALTLGSGLLTACSRSQEAALIIGKAAADYRALVCVFLHGGNDGYNLMVPLTPEKYQLYSDARLDLALPRERLLPLPGTAADGCSYGLHPSCGELAELFGSGHAALLANVGNLAYPTTQADLHAGRVPQGLYSHSDQSSQWQTSLADVISSSGWAGRIADVYSGVNGNPDLPLNLSIAGTNLVQRGARTTGFGVSPAGMQNLAELDAQSGNGGLRAAFDELLHGGAGSDDLLEQTYAQIVDRGIRLNRVLGAELRSAPELGTAFPEDNALAAQLRLVARLIGLRQRLSMQRQIFFVAMGGFDTHKNQAEQHPPLLRKLSQALAAFHAATVELGVADSVTTFTASDFGRTLTTNDGGTDHGWSGHHWIMGGAVRGGRIYGQPPSLVVNGSDDSRGGRFIPQTAVDEYAATLARWFGIGDGDLGYVLPNLGRFASRDLGFMA